MGWSCRADAADTLDRIMAKCRASSGSSNVWNDGKTRYFFESSHTEHSCGKITGSIYKMLDGGKCSRSGSFSISGDGKTVKGLTSFCKMAGV